MQYLKISPNSQMTDLVSLVGNRNTEPILRANNLKRTPNIGKAFRQLCNDIKNQDTDVSWQRKQSILITMVGDSDVFEQASLSDSDDWKVISHLGTFPNYLKIPDTMKIPDTTDTLGDGVHVDNLIYSRVMTCLTEEPHTIDPEIFNSSDTVQGAKIVTEVTSKSSFYQGFHLPWGQVSLYSSLADDSIDFPVYPEEISDRRTANYAQMPDMLYQYEPWQMYQSSGPRTNTYVFTFHRDMWTGDHRDGKANELIRFCEANLYPRYSGSAVNTSKVKLYLGGKVHISGILTDVSTKWSGPIGLDGYYLVCQLSLTITEVSEEALNFDSVRAKSLIG